MVITKYSWHLSVNQLNETPGQNSTHKAECIAQRISPEGLAINTLFISSTNMFNKNMEAEFREILKPIFLELTRGSDFENNIIFVTEQFVNTTQ